MATKTSREKKLGKTIGLCFVLLMIIISMVIAKVTKPEPPAKFKIIIISTTTKVRVETNGRDFADAIYPVNGRVPLYGVIIDGLTYDLPANREVKYGSARNIQEVFYFLKPGQPFNTARVRVDFSN